MRCGCRWAVTGLGHMVQHEFDTVLAFRERGLITRHHADLLRNQTDRLLNALRNDGVEGYVVEIERLRRVGPLTRISFWLYRRFDWSRALKSTISRRWNIWSPSSCWCAICEQLRGQRGEALWQGCRSATQDRARQTYSCNGKRTGCDRTGLPEVHRRGASSLSDSGGPGACRGGIPRHLTEATISVDVFEDLDAQRRVIAARFTRKPELERALDLKGLANRFPFMRSFRHCDHT